MSRWPTHLEIRGLFLAAVTKQAELEARCWMPRKSLGSPRKDQTLIVANARHDTWVKRTKLRWPQHDNGTCRLQNICLANQSNLRKGNLSWK